MKPTTASGYPNTEGAAALPITTLSASDRWRALGGSEGAPRQLEDGCRWVGGAENVEIDSDLIHQCTDGSEGGKITDLNFHFKFVQRVSGLDQLAPHLRSLDLSTNNIRSIEGLGGMTKLRELKLYSCQISRISNLEHCVALMALHLEDNHISAIEGLDALRCLEYLNMDSNRVQKLGKGLARLSRLKELYLSRNQLVSLDGLAGLANLETCALDHNRLRQVSADQVKGLGKLDELRLAGNQLECLSFLAAGVSKTHPSLPSLVQLDASSNRLGASSIRNLPPLPQLAELNLSGNLVEEIEPSFTSSFPSLEILDLSTNQLHRGAEDLEQLKEIVSLRELLIQGNPFTSEGTAEEVQKALAILDCLEFLDDQPLEKRVEVQTLSLEGGEEDTDTFQLTLARGGQQQDDSGSKSRPTSAAGSRPSTAASQRPGTAQKMSEAGVRDPLMHMKPKLSDKRYASIEQVEQWERQTLGGLRAVQKQMDKTCIHIDADLRDMNKFLHKADQVLQRQKELMGKRPPSPDESSFAARREMPTVREEETPQQDSRVKFRLREAVERGREDDEGDEDHELVLEAATLPVSPVASPSRLSPAATVTAACDEEIDEDELPETSPVPSSPEPVEEVEEQLNLGDGEPDASALLLGGLGPRAARAMATAAATVAADTDGKTEQPGLHVDARAKDRGSLVQKRVLEGRPGSGGRPSSRGSQGRPGSHGKTGSQPSQGGQRTRPPAAPVRTSSRGAKR